MTPGAASTTRARTLTVRAMLASVVVAGLQTGLIVSLTAIGLPGARLLARRPADSDIHTAPCRDCHPACLGYVAGVGANRSGRGGHAGLGAGGGVHAALDGRVAAAGRTRHVQGLERHAT